VRADLSAEEVRALSEAGIRVVNPGIEALSTTTLKLMSKGTTAFQNLQLLASCTMHDVYPLWNLLVGLPGESHATYEKYLHDIPFLMHLPPPNGPFPIRFDRFSRYFNAPGEFGLDLRPYDFYQLVYPFGHAAIKDLAYHFMDQNTQAEYFAVMVEWLGRLAEACAAWRRGWEGGNDAGRPQLFMMKRAGETVVHDSRAGTVTEHRLSGLAEKLLRGLQEPRRLDDCLTRIGCDRPGDPEAEIGWLRERGFLFEEGERLLSLVSPSQPTPWSAKTMRHVEAIGRGRG